MAESRIRDTRDPAALHLGCARRRIGTLLRTLTQSLLMVAEALALQRPTSRTFASPFDRSIHPLIFPLLFFFEKKMSVLLPPPKRQKVYHGIPEPENPQSSEESVPNVVVQFVNDQDGSPLAPAVNLPANVTKDALESLVNKLRPPVSL